MEEAIPAPQSQPPAQTTAVIATRRGSPLPLGVMLELAIDNINEGKFMRRCNAQIRRAINELLEYEKIANETSGVAVVTMKVKIGRMKNAKEHFDIKTSVNIQTPSVVETSFVKGVNGKLLVQPTGSSQFDPDQQVMFDSQGRAIGGTDPETGAVVEAPAIAGKIG